MLATLASAVYPKAGEVVKLPTDAFVSETTQISTEVDFSDWPLEGVRSMYYVLKELRRQEKSFVCGCPCIFQATADRSMQNLVQCNIGSRYPKPSSQEEDGARRRSAQEAGRHK